MRLISTARALFLIAGLQLAAHSAQSAPSTIARISAHTGIGQSTTTSAEDTSDIASEGPLALHFTVDTHWRGPFFVYAEHMRSFGEGSTSVGLTGTGLKYYPWIQPAHFNLAAPDTKDSFFGIDGYAYYVGGTIGFGQASIPATEQFPISIAVVFFASAKVGAEMPLSESWGLRSEFNYAMSFAGSGSINYFNLILGIYYSM